MSTVSAEVIFRTWLATRFPSARVVTETPDNLQEVLPCIRVGRFGGGRESFPAFDLPNVDIDAFAADRETARTLAHQIGDALLFELPGQTVAGAIVERVGELSGPSITPWDNTTLRRFAASYSARIHSPF